MVGPRPLNEVELDREPVVAAHHVRHPLIVQLRGEDLVGVELFDNGLFGL